MRYVILFVTSAGFLIWDGLYNGGRYMDMAVKSVDHLLRMVTG